MVGIGCIIQMRELENSALNLISIDTINLMQYPEFALCTGEYQIIITYIVVFVIAYQYSPLKVNFLYEQYPQRSAL